MSFKNSSSGLEKWTVTSYGPVCSMEVTLMKKLPLTG